MFVKKPGGLLSFSESIDKARERLQEVPLLSLFNLRMLGFALIRAWVYLMFLGAATSVMTWNGESLPPAAFLGSTISLCALLFSCAFIRKYDVFINGTKIFRIAGPVCTCVGTLCLASATLPGAPVVLFCIIGAVFTGVGSGIIDLGYGDLYRNVEPLRTSLEAPLAFLIAAVIYLGVQFLPPIADVLIVAALPAVSGYLLFVHFQVWSPKHEFTVLPFKIHLGTFSWKIGACACLTGMADGTVRAVFLFTSDTTVQDFYRFPLLWAGIITLVIIYGCALFSQERGFKSMYRTVMLIMAIFFMLLPVFTGYSEIESIIGLAGYGTFNVLIWILLADITSTYRLSGIMVFGVGWGMVTLGFFLGSQLGQILCLGAPFSPQMLSLIALLATVAILISYMFVFSERDLEQMATSEEEDGGKVLSDAQGHPTETQDGMRRQRFQDRCNDVASQYGLTERETEIMVLFAKGRSAARIQEELFLSRGTVSTHLRHVYQKLDVHSKQELIDLIEGAN